MASNGTHADGEAIVSSPVSVFEMMRKLSGIGDENYSTIQDVRHDVVLLKNRCTLPSLSHLIREIEATINATIMAPAVVVDEEDEEDEEGEEDKDDEDDEDNEDDEKKEDGEDEE